jgi:hypothetical protein
MWKKIQQNFEVFSQQVHFWRVSMFVYISYSGGHVTSRGIWPTYTNPKPRHLWFA